MVDPLILRRERPAGDSLREDWGRGCGRSKMWRVDLSDVTARSLLLGDIAIEKTRAWSTPRRSSPVRAQFPVEKVRTNVPFKFCYLRYCPCSRGVNTVSLAVASTSPSGLISIALNGVPCAGIMLTFPVPISTNCTCPGVRPGKATILDPRQQSPNGLLAVSKTESFSGGEEKAYKCTLLYRTTMMRVRERQTRLTGERNSRVMTAFCFASSHMMTWCGAMVSGGKGTLRC